MKVRALIEKVLKAPKKTDAEATAVEDAPPAEPAPQHWEITGGRIACGVCQEMVDARATTTLEPHGIVCEMCAERISIVPVPDLPGYRG